MAIPELIASFRCTVGAVQRGLVTHDSLFALVGLLLVCCVYLVVVYHDLTATLTDPELVKAFVGKDSSHYLEMAESFRSGQFLDKYVTTRPHRQPLYPALLAAAMALASEDLVALGTVNVLIGLVTIIFMYGAGWWLFGSWWVGLAGALGYASSDFIVGNISGRLLTEPTFALAGLLAVMFALKYMECTRAAYLCAAAGGAGLAYLARPNGLFLMIAMWTTLLAHDLLRRYLPVSGGAAAAKAESSSRALDRRQLIARFGLAALIFVLVATPSWIPRAVYYGDPVYHGYLSNYLWVDTYQEGHISEPRYGPRDYFRTHDFTDIPSRVGEGLQHVFWTAPTKIGPILYTLALIGMMAGLVSLRPSHLFLLVFMFVQSVPLIWTAVSNPNLRVHYGGLFPFWLLFVMILADRCRLGLKQFPSISRRLYRTASGGSISGNRTEQPQGQGGSVQRGTHYSLRSWQ